MNLDNQLINIPGQIISGAALRQLRLSNGVALRQIAREAKLSYGHLSKVERSEPYRQVTPAVIAAYEKAIGVNIRVRLGDDGGSDGWRIGHLHEAEAQDFAATVAGIAVGGPLRSPHARGEGYATQLASYVEAHRLHPLTEADEADVSRLRQVADALEVAGGQVPGLAAREVLYAVALPLLGDRAPRELMVTAGRLARLAGHAVALRSHDAGRALYLVALSLASRADDPQLVASVLADIAEQLRGTGNDEVAVRVARFGLHDERINEQARRRLRTVIDAAAETGTCHDDQV